MSQYTMLLREYAVGVDFNLAGSGGLPTLWGLPLNSTSNSVTFAYNGPLKVFRNSGILVHGPYFLGRSSGAGGEPAAVGPRVGGGYYYDLEADAARANVEVLMGIATTPAWPGTFSFLTSTSSGRWQGVAVRASGVEAAATGYVAVAQMSTGKLRIYKLAAGVHTLLGETVPGSWVPSGGDCYLRFRANGASLSATLWIREGEANAVTLSVNDASIAAAGKVGPVWYVPNGDAIDAGYGEVMFMTFGTDGDEAPMPRSYLDLAEFLMGDTAERLVLAEAHPLISTVGGVPGSGAIAAMATGTYCTGNEGYLPNLPYDEILLQVPNITMRAGEFFTGKASLTYGDAIVANENGERSDWLRYNWDGREFELFIGGRGWPRWDFYKVFSAVIKDVYVPSPGRIGFRLTDSLAHLKTRINDTQIGGTGPNAGAYRPVMEGVVFNAPLLLEDYATLTYRLDDEATQGAPVVDVRNNGASIAATIAITAADPVTDYVTIPAHGAAVGNFVVPQATDGVSFTLVQDWVYYVKTVVDANRVELGRVSFGGVLSGLTAQVNANTVGIPVRVQRWSCHSGIPGKVQLNTDPGSGDLTADTAYPNNDMRNPATVFSIPYTQNGLANTVYRLTQRVGGVVPTVPMERAGPNGFYYCPDLQVGLHKQGEVDGLATISELATAAGALVSVNSMGRLYVASVEVPPSEADFILLESDVDYDSFKPERLVLPAYAEQLGYSKNNHVQSSGLALTVSATNAARFKAEASFTTVAEHVPASAFSGAALHRLSEKPPARVTLLTDAAEAATEASRIAEMRAYPLVVFSMNVRVYQTLMLLGHRVHLTHSKYGFEGGKYGIVVGKVENLDTNGTQLLVLFQVDEAWATVGASDIAGRWFTIPVENFYQRSL